MQTQASPVLGLIPWVRPRLQGQLREHGSLGNIIYGAARREGKRAGEHSAACRILRFPRALSPLPFPLPFLASWSVPIREEVPGIILAVFIDKHIMRYPSKRIPILTEDCVILKEGRQGAARLFSF